jgi:hypothetical protein
VRRAVIEDDVDVEIGRDLAIESLQERLELDRPVPAVQRPDHLAGAEVQGGVEARGAVALVVMRRALGQPRPHRQDRRRAVQRLDLGLLVHAQHDGALGRVEVEADDVSDLGHELRIARQLKRLGGDCPSFCV